jgi:hypothetical protein
MVVVVDSGKEQVGGKLNDVLLLLLLFGNYFGRTDRSHHQ